jgi:predicted nucleic acid-binding protein
MTVISNTSPLNYLALIDLQDVLPALFEHVLIPEAVWHELRSPAASQPVKDFLDTCPSWLERRVVSQVPPDLLQLDPRGSRRGNPVDHGFEPRTAVAVAI